MLKGYLATLSLGVGLLNKLIVEFEAPFWAAPSGLGRIVALCDRLSTLLQIH